MSKARDLRKYLSAVVAFAMAVATLAIAGLGSQAFGDAPTSSDAAAPAAATGKLKIVKNLGGPWTADSFIFTWDCTDGQSGQEVFTTDFNGANRTVDAEFPIGTECTVEETSGTLEVGDYNVTTHIEGTSGFQEINPRVVPIDNSQGTNTIQFMNELDSPVLTTIIVKKQVVNPPGDLDFQIGLFCDDDEFGTVEIIGDGEMFSLDVPAGAECSIGESPDPSYALSATLNGVNQAIVPVQPGGFPGFQFVATDTDSIVLTNTFRPRVGGVEITKQVIAPEGSDAADATFPFGLFCEDDAPGNGTALGDGESVFFEVLLGQDCFAAEHDPGRDWVVWATLNGQPVNLYAADDYVGVHFEPSGEDSIVVYNCYVADPYFNKCRPIIDNDDA